MRKYVFLLSSFLLAAGALSAQTVPSLVNYQGRLLDNAGNPRSGNVSVTVAIHTNEVVSSQVYTESIGAVTVNNGLFAFQFGAGAGFAAALANAEAWLEVAVDGVSVGPRQRLVAVPYAVAAGTVRGANLYEDPGSGAVGVGTTSPSANYPLTIRERTGFNTYIQLQTTDGANKWHVGGNGGGINFVESGVADYRLFLRPGGNVGVGTSLPGERLTVNGAVTIGTTANATPAAGTIRWTGSDLQVFNGTQWISLTYNPPPLVSPQLVTVGNSGNADDPNSNGLGGNSGAVPYTFAIGKYEVTNAEYGAFLNAVDPNGLNALALYNASMGSDSSNGGITFSPANADGSKYVVKGGFENKPVVYVSFYDAMRFCNWLHNGAQAGGDTENGAYTLQGNTATPSNGTTVTRNTGAKYAVPTEDEWYKAAYHQPVANGGDTDSYWLYPTKSNSVPSASNPPGAAPAANYNSIVGSVTAVGAYTPTIGYYGTWDMAGNVFEWTEELSSVSRVLRGGAWNSFDSRLRADSPFGISPDFEYFTVGFRVSSP